MAKTKHRILDTERVYGRISLADLTENQINHWVVRAIAGDTRQFTKPSDISNTKTIQEAVTISSVNGLGLRCGTCEIQSFITLEEQYAHFKSDLHRMNLKNKAKGKTIFKSYEEANEQAIIEDNLAGKEDELESSSSSESSDQNGQQVSTDKPVIEFTDDKRLYKIWKTLIPNIGEDSFNPYISLHSLVSEKKFKWAVFLLRSGRFAGAIFNKDQAICHKTFQRYTTRRKQGGSQASSDASGGKAKSAGATLRRYNEAALKQDIAELLHQWKEHLKTVDLIFISSGKADRSTFFSPKMPTLNAQDSRLRRIPFVTFRPTFEEVCRVRSELFSVRFAPIPKVDEKQIQKSQGDSIMSTSQITDAFETAGINETKPEVLPPPKFIELILNEHADAKDVLDFITDAHKAGNAVFDINVTDSSFMTALHHAAEQDLVEIISLLLSKGADPSMLDIRRRPPYFLCTTKEARNVFRRFLASNPNAWDYTASQIPGALTEEMEQAKKEKELEKKRRARERKKQQKKDQAEKLRIEAEAKEKHDKAMAAAEACDNCGNHAGRKPFERLNFKYCSTNCVQEHKRKILSEAALKRFGG